MKTAPIIKRIGIATTGIALASVLGFGTAHAAASPNRTTADTQRLNTILTKGNQEISRRLTTLNNLTAKINGAPKLSAADKTTLSGEVSTEITNLTALKTKLDADTDLATARADAQSIFTEYRVYALVAPKVALVRVADDQLANADKLTTLSQKLQTRLTTAKNDGKDVSALQTKLDDMATQITNATSVSSSIQQKVITLQPSDYNSDHTILGDDRDQLKTARTDLQNALTDGKAIVSGLKNL